MKKKKRAIIVVLEWARSLILALAVALIINKVLLVNAVVISSSMESTIMTDSRVMGLRIAYAFAEPKRFDVVLFKFPDDESSLPFVKRIIGLPNEKIEIKDGKVYINDSNIPLDDSFIKEEAKGDYGPYIIPEDSYFMLGDNRNNSKDSKNWDNKYVSKSKILGKVLIEYYPTPKVIS